MMRLFRDASIRTKLIFTHLLLIILPTILIIGIFYSSLYDLIVNDSVRQEFATSRQSAEALEAQLIPITAVSSAIRSNTFIRQLCTESVTEEAKNELLQNNAVLTDLATQINSDIDGTMISSIHIYSDHVPEDLYDNWLLDDLFLPVSECSGTYWNGIMNSSTRTELYCPSFYLSHKEIDSYGALAYIEKLYPTSDASFSSPSYLAIYFPEDEFTRILRQDISDGQGVSYIIGEREDIVASSDPALAGAYFMNYETVQGIASSDAGYTTRTVMDQEVYAASFPLGNTDWYMASVMPASQVTHRGIVLIRNFALIYLFTLVVAFLIALFLSRSINIRLFAIIDRMREARYHPPVSLPDPKTHDEIGELTDSYNFMATRQNLLAKRQKETAEELRISEISALQAQINPHFLYNTMDMINWLSQKGEQGEVTRAIQALSSFYKLTLSRKDPITDLGSELEHIKLYVELQNMRFEEMITLTVDVPDELMSVSLPKLTLQPIVENSILHGILEKESGKGTIVVAAWEDDTDVVILISDDGIGMDGEALAMILSEDNKNATGTNIAVFNTHRRLQILFGEEYGLSYSSEEGIGTEVSIRIPKAPEDAAVQSSVKME